MESKEIVYLVYNNKFYVFESSVSQEILSDKCVSIENYKVETKYTKIVNETYFDSKNKYIFISDIENDSINNYKLKFLEEEFELDSDKIYKILKELKNDTKFNLTNGSKEISFKLTEKKLIKTDDKGKKLYLHIKDSNKFWRGQNLKIKEKNKTQKINTSFLNLINIIEKVIKDY